MFVRKSRYGFIAALATVGIVAHLGLRFGAGVSVDKQLWPLWLVLFVGGVPLTVELLAKLIRGEFGSDLLAGISIVTSVLLEEYLAGSLVVLMLSGGEALRIVCDSQRIQGFGSPRAAHALDCASS